MSRPSHRVWYTYTGTYTSHAGCQGQGCAVCWPSDYWGPMPTIDERRADIWRYRASHGLEFFCWVITASVVAVYLRWIIWVLTLQEPQP